jgi:UDP-N-acetylglucosamine 2-epimerase (non-hydrolysing)
MSDIFIEQLELKRPDYFLGINRLSSPQLISQMILELEKIYNQHRPDFVVVYGDTDSTLAAALTAKKMDIKVVHIEAGLRQEPKSMPEEINRVLTDHLSHLLFVSSELGIKNLQAEGIYRNIFNVGDIMHDLFKQYATEFNDSILN